MRAQELDPVESAVVELCAELASNPNGRVTLQTGLAEVGIDSLAVAEIAIALEERFGVRLADLDGTTVRTVGDLVIGAGRQMRPRPRVAPDLGQYQRLVHVLAGWFVRLYCRLEVEEAENVPATGPAILASNHRSMWDVPVHVAATPRQVTFMAKQELFTSTFMEWAWRKMGGFPVRRATADIRAVDTSVAVLERGGLLFLYPEGTRSRAGHMLPFLHGAAWMALKTGAPIVPCGIVGTERKPAHKPKFGRWVRVRFGPPIAAPREDDPRARIDKAHSLTTRVFDAVTSLS